MNERVVQFRVGVMVLTTGFITAFLIALFDGLPTMMIGQPYTLYLRFSDAPGVSTGTPVTKSGIRIGRVAKVQFAEDIHPGETGVIVTVHIDSNRKIRRDEEPQLRRALLGVGGDTTIEFVRRRKLTQAGIVNVKDSNEDIPPGSMIQGESAVDPMSAIGNLEGNLGATLQSLAHTSDEIGMLARRVNDLIQNNDEQLIRIVGKTETAIDNINNAAKSANNLIGDPALQQNIKKVAQDLPQTIAQINTAINSMQQTFEAADRNLRNFEGLTKPLGERGPQLVATIEQAMQKINNVAENLDSLTAAINSSDGTIGQLINDKALYEQVLQTIANVNCMIKDLKPIVDNAKVFTDKIARHPETIGLGGAIKRGSGLK